MSFLSSNRFTRQQARKQIATLLSLLLFQLEDGLTIARIRQARATHEAILSALLRFALDKRNTVEAVLDKLCHAMAANGWLFSITSEKVRELQQQDSLSVEHERRVQQHHQAVRRNLTQ